MKFISTTTCSIVTMVCLFLIKASFAQDPNPQSDTTEYWKEGGSLNINFSQVALQNWTGGGQNSISATGSLGLFLNYGKEKVNWDNTLKVGYGLLRQGKISDFRKSDDRLTFRSNYMRDINENFRLSASVNFRTAMTKGFNYPVNDQGEEEQIFISDFMAPGYTIASAGVKYSPFDQLNISLSPITGKTTFVLNDTLSAQGRYGVEAGNKIRQEIGSNLNIALKGNLIEDVAYETEANFFSNYENPAEIDVQWDAKLILNVNEYLVTTISTNLIYDEDIEITREDGTVGPAVQFKEVLAVGFNYKFE